MEHQEQLGPRRGRNHCQAGSTDASYQWPQSLRGGTPKWSDLSTYSSLSFVTRMSPCFSIETVVGNLSVALSGVVEKFPKAFRGGDASWKTTGHAYDGNWLQGVRTIDPAYDVVLRHLRISYTACVEASTCDRIKCRECISSIGLYKSREQDRGLRSIQSEINDGSVYGQVAEEVSY